MTESKTFEQQTQSLPGTEKKMHPRPKDEDSAYKGSDKLKDKVAIITGGDSGIGKAVAIAFAKEGADVVIAYLNEHEDANSVKKRVEELKRKCLLIPGDLSDAKHAQSVVEQTIKAFGKLDVLVNHVGEQYQQDELGDISDQQLEEVFRVNVFSLFYITKAALKHMKEGASIVNTVSIVAYEGHPVLIDYTASKAAVVGFTRALAKSLTEKGIRVNGVAPGPIWTPLIPASFDADKVAKFGSNTPMKRAGQPFELAPAYVYLASNIDASYVSGQVIHVNGGKIING